MKFIITLLKLIIAVIFLQSLYCKFSAHPQAIYIFTMLDLEPYGRIGIGIAELVLSVLIFIPRYSLLAIFGSLGMMIGAVYSHLTKIGIVVRWNEQGDGGILFSMAIIVCIISSILIFINVNDYLTKRKINQ